MIKLLGFASLCSSSLGHFYLWDDIFFTCGVIWGITCGVISFYLWGDCLNKTLVEAQIWTPLKKDILISLFNSRASLSWSLIMSSPSSAFSAFSASSAVCHHPLQHLNGEELDALAWLLLKLGEALQKVELLSANANKHDDGYDIKDNYDQNSTENNSMGMATKKIISAKISTMCRMRIEDQLAVESPRLGGWWGWACSHMSNAWEPIPHNVTHPQTLVGTVRAQPAPNGSLIVFSSSSSIHSYGDCSLYLHDDSPSWS